MADAAHLHHLLGRFRAFPALYDTTRWMYRSTAAIPREVLRALAPNGSRFGAPKGFFSVLDLLDRGAVTGRVLFRAQETPEAGVDSMIAHCGFEQDRQQPWPAFWARLGETRLVGPALLPLDGHKRACLEAMYRADGGFERNPSNNYLVLPPPVRLNGPWTSLVSVLGGHFYHWFHDELPRLWALPEFPPETRILVPANPAPYVRETLRLLGLEDRAHPAPERHLLIEDFYFTAPTALMGCPNPHALHFLRERFLPQRSPAWNGPRRIYLTRANKTRGMVNAAEVEAFFRGRGWAVVDPEILSLPDQIALFADAEALCGLHGGAFTNLVWCSPGCQVLELFAEGFFNGCYEGIALCHDLPHRWLEFPADGEYRAAVNMEHLATAVAQLES